MRRVMKVLCVLGTRPEAIKMAPVVWELQKYPDQIEAQVCVTAQHRGLLDQVLEIFTITPQHDLDIMQAQQSPVQVIRQVLKRLEPVLVAEQPDWVLVQGDTTSVMATALLAFHHHLRVGHVEAGLRTHDNRRPFPEEINRRLASVMTDLHFAPTAWARDNLLQEGVPAERVRVTGNPVIDTLQWALTWSPSAPQFQKRLEQLGLAEAPAEAPAEQRLILVTAHRRENFGRPLEQICLALRELAERYAGTVRILYPVHPNPNVQAPVRRLLGAAPHITLTEPLDYLTLVQVLKRTCLVLTDSGGLQEEAPSLGIPVLVLREVTERPEGVEAGTVQVVGTNQERIVAAAACLLDMPEDYQRMAQAINPYGDGHAAERIVRALLDEEY
jgi:UDP-N-acetylglucosamine 2-epimerase (non-hydrolysing)